MRKKTDVIRSKLLFLVVCQAFLSFIFSSCLSSRLLPIVVNYGEYQCENIIVQMANNIALKNINDRTAENIVNYNQTDKFLDFNVEILNSILINTINELRLYLKKIEQGYRDDFIENILNYDSNFFLDQGIIYAVPLGKVFDNILVSNLGMNIPVRYKITNQISGLIVSDVEEYGINNALLEVKLIINAKSRVIIPAYSEEKNIEICIPLVMKVIKGEIPDVFLGTNILGGEE